MTAQNSALVYAQAVQSQLQTIAVAVPVYANHNRNWATEPKFVTWHIRNIHQAVYTGNTQAVKGIDRPIVQINIFAQTMTDSFTLANAFVQSLHGFSGTIGGTLYVTKSDVSWLYSTYDAQVNLHQVVLDVQLDISA